MSAGESQSWAPSRAPSWLRPLVDNVEKGPTAYLHRLPAAEWIGFETTYHGADEGVAVGEARLYDEQGPIGIASCVALSQKRPPPPPPSKD